MFICLLANVFEFLNARLLIRSVLPPLGLRLFVNIGYMCAFVSTSNGAIELVSHNRSWSAYASVQTYATDVGSGAATGSGSYEDSFIGGYYGPIILQDHWAIEDAGTGDVVDGGVYASVKYKSNMTSENMTADISAILFPGLPDNKWVGSVAEYVLQFDVTFAVVGDPTHMEIEWDYDGYYWGLPSFDVPDLSGFEVGLNRYLLPVGAYSFAFYANGFLDNATDPGSDIYTNFQFRAAALTTFAPASVIPEPTSRAIWSAIALGGLGMAYRRRWETPRT